MRRGEEEDEAIRITLSDKNIQYFVNAIDKAKEKYQKEMAKREPELLFVKGWNVPEFIRHNEKYIQVEHRRSIMKPFFSDGKWKSEKAFIEFLEKSENVEWWFKNGVGDKTFFALPYDNGEQKPFYVDFVIKLKDGRIGLFDTKSGLTQKVAGPKVDGLYKYIQSENNKGKELFGGIVTNTDRDYRGRWVYFDRMSKDLRDGDFSNWRDLEL
jgi:type III restriction enzyme